MRVYLEGQILGYHEGVSRKSNKSYTYADLYDGSNVYRIFGADSSLGTVSSIVTVPCVLFVDWDNRSLSFSLVK